MFLLLAVAHAAEPGGFRVAPHVPVTEVQLREVAALAPGGAYISQTTLVGRVGAPSVSASIEAPLAVSGGPGWAGYGIGNPRLAILGHLEAGEKVQLAAGAELATRIPSWELHAQAWGSHKREASVGSEGLMVFGVTSTSDAPWTLRLAAGVRGGTYYEGIAFFSWAPVADLGLVKVQPVSEHVALVAEGELLVDDIPVSARALMRYEGPGWAVDVGLQGIVPLTGWPLPALVTQLRGRL